jgi:aldose 1-epimerase
LFILVYTAGGLDLKVSGLNGQHYTRFGAICLEDQGFADAVNKPNFPSIFLKPNDVYKHVCEIEIKSIE